ncbi:MAG: C25 family cysteine peptidase [Anaerolineae bacterium]
MFALSLPWFAPAIAVDALPACDTKTSSTQADQGLTLIKSDEESIVLELCTSGYRVEEKRVGGVVYHSLSIKGYGEMSEVGRPQLPFKGVMLGVPPGIKFEVQVLETDSLVAAERYNVYPVPKVVIREDLYSLESLLEPYGLSSKSMEYVFAKDEGVYSTNAFYPTDLVEVHSSGYIRDQRFVQLQLNPLQYNPVTQQLRFHKRMKVELQFVYDEGKALARTRIGEINGPFEEALRNTILNYDSARRWRTRAAFTPVVGTQGVVTLLASQLSWKIAVNQDGIYQLTYDDLQNAGIDVDNVNPQTFQLFNQGSEVAIYVEGEDDGIFNTNDYILFYGQKMNTKYTDVNIYWLTYGESTGLRMGQRNGAPTGAGTVPTFYRATEHLEKDKLYLGDKPRVEGGDHWYWNYTRPPSIPSQTYTTALNNLATGPYSGTLRIKMQGHTSIAGVDPDHHVKIYVNGNLVEDVSWDGPTEQDSLVQFPSSYLREGTNTILAKAPNDTGAPVDLVLFNWFEIDYHDTYVAEDDILRFSSDEAGTWEYHIDDFTTNDIEIFDVTDPMDASRILNAAVEPGSSYTLKFEDTITDRTEYLALTTAQHLSPLSIVQDTPSDLRSASNGADYIFITHSDFYTDAQPLTDRRAGQGLRTMVVDVQDVYDEFSYGIFDAQGIRDFLAYAYANWTPPAPSYVLLVGDGNFDFKNNLGNSPLNRIPPYLALVDPTIGETASDNLYVTVNGDDILPDMHIGRLPVNSSAEASTVINKILDYEQNPPSGDWNQRALFVADNADDAGDFAALSDDIADNYLPSAYIAHKVYYQVTHFTQSETTAAIIEAINDGRLLANYVGHGGNALWAAEGLFRADATRNDIGSLTNGPRLLMMLSMTCATGYFHYPSIACLDESLIRAQGKGTIASWSPTGFGMALGHHYLDQGFFTAVFTDTISEIGTATYLGKLNLYENTTGYRDLIDTYVLFGDPFMKLNLPACDAADFDNDGRITVVDIMQVAARWGTQWGDEDYDRKYDLDDDGPITVADIMRVAAQWRKTCATP